MTDWLFQHTALPCAQYHYIIIIIIIIIIGHILADCVDYLLSAHLTQQQPF
jgi:hypothetical protein